jgi:mannose-6-phosphate isomerase-like protein (cupin superfamily)
MRQFAWLCLSAALLGCPNGEGSGRTPESASSPPATSAATAAAPVPPSRVEAHFVDHARERVSANICDRFFVASARGRTTALGETLGEGDALSASSPDPFDVETSDLALIVVVHIACVPKTRPAFLKSVVRRADRSDLVWAGGAMKARLYFEEGAPYFGALEGTAPVAEHNHPTSWEVLSAIEGAGVFTVDGKPTRLGPRSVVTVPPATKHSWQPDPGSKLVAFQVYDPPGPEQRFKGLAAAAAAGGTDAGK